MKNIEKADLLITGCSAVMPDASVTEDAAIAVKDGKIVYIGRASEPGAKVGATETLNARGKLAMPGMYDCHTHSVQQLLKGGAVDEPPIVWRRILVPYEASAGDEDRYHAALLYCLQMIRAGVTMFSDAGTVNMEPCVRAVEQTGIQALITQPCWDSDLSLPEAVRDKNAGEALRKAERLYKSFDGYAQGRIRVCFSFSSPDTASPELIRLLGEAAGEYGVRLHTHLCQHIDEVKTCVLKYRMRPAELLESCGVLNDRLLAAHCIHVTDRDIHMMAERGVNIVHCPSSNLTTQGLPKYPAECAAGARVSLGNDGAAVARQDMFYQAQLLKFITHACFATLVYDTVGLSIKEAYEMITINGARALGVRDRLGTLETGKQADIVLVDLRTPALSPSRNILNTVIMAGSANDVSDVLIKGKIILKNREFTGLDEEKILSEGKLRLRKLMEKI
ncbi:MAG: amidohydrolase family protein [Bacillota bacterium]|nr:amidohydrolase family protein [Bacillota bacterium]